MSSSNKSSAAKKQDDRQLPSDITTPLPPISDRGDYTTVPNEFLKFGQAYPDNGAAMAFLLWFIQHTYGGQYDVSTWGPKAKALREKGRRPKWLPLTISQVAEIIAVETEDEAQDLIDFLQNEARVLVSHRDAGKVWYALDYERMGKLKPTGQGVPSVQQGGQS
jgi:hypothetical protein